MNYNYENFVLTVDNFFTQEECDAVVRAYNNCAQLGLTITRKKQSDNPSHKISDDQLYVSDLAASGYDMHHLAPFGLFTTKFWEHAYPAYSEKYSILSTISHHTCRILKFQKTEIGEGYHTWHQEDDSPENMRRVLTFILYLNDVHEGGETEFLYYPKRVKAETGKLILWPAGFTHAHRGNPPLSNTKYILTGWIELS